MMAMARIRIVRIVIATDTIPAPACGEKDRRFACEYPVDNGPE
jgi:hypothetical protein